MKAKKLFTKQWDFDIYEVKDKKVITVMFFDQVDYPRSFYLNQEVDQSNYESLTTLSQEIRNHYENFKDSEIIPPIFD